MSEPKEPDQSAQDGARKIIEGCDRDGLQYSIATALAAKDVEIYGLKHTISNMEGNYKASHISRTEHESTAKALQTAYDDVKALRAERDQLKQQLETERKGWPHEQPLTDISLDRQIVLLNRQLVDKEQHLQQAVGLLRTCQGALGWRSISEFLSSPSIIPIRERLRKESGV